MIRNKIQKCCTRWPNDLCSMALPFTLQMERRSLCVHTLAQTTKTAARPINGERDSIFSLSCSLVRSPFSHLNATSVCTIHTEIGAVRTFQVVSLIVSRTVMFSCNHAVIVSATYVVLWCLFLSDL